MDDTNSKPVKLINPQIIELTDVSGVILDETEETTGYYLHNTSELPIYFKYQDVGDNVVADIVDSTDYHFFLAPGEKKIETSRTIGNAIAGAASVKRGETAKLFIGLIKS